MSRRSNETAFSPLWNVLLLCLLYG